MEFIKQHGLMILALGMLGAYGGWLYDERSKLLQVNACMAGEVSEHIYRECLDKQEAR